MSATSFDPNRTLHLVDLPNLIGGPLRGHRVPNVLQRFLQASAFQPGDHLVVAADQRLARTAVFEVPSGARFLACTQTDAPHRLIDAVPAELIARRYGRLVIGSGDHRLRNLAIEVRSLGIPVTVLAVPQSLSGSLRRSADTYVPLGAFPGSEAA